MKLLFRSHNHIWLFALLVFGLTSVLLLPFVAYADDYEGGGGGSHNIGGSYPNFGTVWFDKQAVSNGLDVSPIRVRYGVVAYTNWDAAMYCLRGTDFSDSISNTKKRKLLADSDFRDFGNLFKVGKPEATNDWSGDASIVLAWNSARELYGETYCYSVIYTMDQWNAADAALRRIMTEDDTPSGSGGIGSSSPNDMRMIAYRWDAGYNGIDFGDPIIRYYVSGNPPTPDTMYVKYNSYMKNLIQENPGYVVVGHLQNLDRLMFLLVPEGKVELVMRETQYNGETVQVPSRFHVASSHFAKIVFNNLSASLFEVSDGDEELDTVTFTMPESLRPGSIEWYTQVWNEDTPSPIYVTDYQGEIVPDPDPPVTWPTTPPTTPVVPPDTPNPGDPTVPVDPTPPTPWSPIPGIDIDITGDDFQDLLDALNEHCIHLQTSIQDNISQLWSLQSDLISDRFDWLGNDVIIASFTSLKDYLHQLFEWLAERMNFNLNYTNGAYDDSSVITWLKKIWAKLGDGINTQPTDPVTEPDDWWAWLLALMSNFVGMLFGFGSDKLSAVGDALGALTSKFPFSLPWDLAALLALLDAPPQIPEWDIPCFAVSLEGLQQVGTYHITLEDYDNVWENVRWIERLSFIVLLIRSSDFFTGLMRRAVGHD